MAKERNFFANAKTLTELEDRFESMVSPENLFADGERSRTEANRRYKRLSRDFSHRESEIRLADLNASRNAVLNGSHQR